MDSTVKVARQQAIQPMRPAGFSITGRGSRGAGPAARRRRREMSDRARRATRSTCGPPRFPSGGNEVSAERDGPVLWEPRETRAPALRLRVFDRDPLDDVRDVLGHVDRRLEEVVDLLPLHEL